MIYRIHKTIMNLKRRYKTDEIQAYILNRTDGYSATIAEPYETGLPTYVIFNDYGSYGKAASFLIPRKHRQMIVEIAAIDASKSTRCRRFNWNEMVPVEVSETPKILLRGRRLKRAQKLYFRHEWEVIFRFIARNRYAIKQHWLGKCCSLGIVKCCSAEIGKSVHHFGDISFAILKTKTAKEFTHDK